MYAHTIDQLNLGSQEVSRDYVKKKSQLADIEDELCYERAKPFIIDNWHLITSRKIKVGKKSEPEASLR